MSSARPHRVADRIQAELSDILRRRLKDPRLGFLTVTAVEVTGDLQIARVYISALSPKEVEAGLTTLERARGFLRSELSRRLHLRKTPELDFRADTSADHGLRVGRILSDLREAGEFDDEETT